MLLSEPDVKGARYSKPKTFCANHWLIGEEMNIEKLIHDLRARINPHYDQTGTESKESGGHGDGISSVGKRAPAFRFWAMNQSLDLVARGNERLKADAELIEWQPIETAQRRN